VTCANIGLTVLAAANIALLFTWPNPWVMLATNILIILIAWTMVICKPCAAQAAATPKSAKPAAGKRARRT